MEFVDRNIQILTELRELIKSITAQRFINTNNIITNHSIGSYVEEVVHYYQNLISGIYRNEIKYDAQVNDHSIKLNYPLALAAIDDIIFALQGLNEDRKLAVSGLEEQTQELSSTVTRELAYNYDHTNHLLSMIKIALQVEKPRASA
ncbi:MAG: hypothetical protein JXQ90_08435 [Cyclobacteriaceae bacterium]